MYHFNVIFRLVDQVFKVMDSGEVGLQRNVADSSI